jgi:rod shape-determining protein MreC
VALSRRTGRSRFTLILLLLTSITVITLDFRSESSGFIDDIREGALDAFTPVKDTADSVFSPVSNAWNGIFNYDDLEDENARLKQQLAEARGDRSEAEAISTEHEELLSLQKLPFTGAIPKEDARVITSPVSNFELSFQINKGRGAGISKGMPVVAGDGLVGRVVRVSANQSVVQLLTDRDWAGGIKLVRSNEVALAEGRGRDNPLDGSLISPKVKVREGERVVTSGLVQSGAYPPGIPVGKVLRVEEAEGGLDQRAEIEPHVDVDHLTFVSVLKWEPPR